MDIECVIAFSILFTLPQIGIAFIVANPFLWKVCALAFEARDKIKLQGLLVLYKYIIKDTDSLPFMNVQRALPINAVSLYLNQRKAH